MSPSAILPAQWLLRVRSEYAIPRGELAGHFRRSVSSYWLPRDHITYPSCTISHRCHCRSTTQAQHLSHEISDRQFHATNIPLHHPLNLFVGSDPLTGNRSGKGTIYIYYLYLFATSGSYAVYQFASHRRTWVSSGNLRPLHTHKPASFLAHVPLITDDYFAWLLPRFGYRLLRICFLVSVEVNN